MIGDIRDRDSQLCDRRADQRRISRTQGGSVDNVVP